MNIVYEEAVLKAVTGSSATDTYGAKAVPLAAEIDAFIAKLKVQDPATGIWPAYTITHDDPMVNRLRDYAVTLRVTAYAADSAINALGVYSVPGFYEDVLKPTRASEDGGRLAANVLRQIVPGST